MGGGDRYSRKERQLCWGVKGEVKRWVGSVWNESFVRLCGEKAVKGWMLPEQIRVICEEREKIHLVLSSRRVKSLNRSMRTHNEQGIGGVSEEWRDCWGELGIILVCQIVWCGWWLASSGTRPKPEWQPRKEVYKKGVVPSTVCGVGRTGRILILSTKQLYINSIWSSWSLNVDLRVLEKIETFGHALSNHRIIIDRRNVAIYQVLRTDAKKLQFNTIQYIELKRSDRK